MSKLEAKFLDEWLRLYPSNPPIKEHKFHQTRQWRFDFAWPKSKIAVEIQGYGPGHNSLPGMEADYEKHLQALLYGWRTVFLTGNMITEENLTYVYKLAFPNSPSHPQRHGTDYVEQFRRKVAKAANRR